MSEQAERPTTEQAAQDAPIVYERHARAMGRYARDFRAALVAEGVPAPAAGGIVRHWVRHVLGSAWGPAIDNNGVCAGVPPLWGVPSIAAGPLLDNFANPVDAEDGDVMMRAVAATVGAFARALVEGAEEADGDRAGRRHHNYELEAFQQDMVLAYFDRLLERWQATAAASGQLGLTVHRDAILAAARAERRAD